MEALKLAMPVIKSSFVVDCILELTDNETKRVVAVEKSNILDFEINVGDEVKGGVALEALRTGKRQVLEKDSNAFGKPYSAVATPIYDDGKLVGVLTVGYPTTEKDKLKKLAENLSAFVEQFTASMDQVTSTSEQMLKSGKTVVDQSQNITEEMNETTQIIDSVKHISKQTQILGINASIEAARVGVEGRGFAVVANEIQRLAVTTQEAAKSIENTLKTVYDVFHKVHEDINIAFGSSQEQQQALLQMQNGVQRLSSLAEQLKTIAGSIHM